MEVVINICVGVVLVKCLKLENFCYIGGFCFLNKNGGTNKWHKV